MIVSAIERSPYYIISFKYDRQLVSDIKRYIPATNRKYDGDKFEWTLDYTGFTILQRICSDLGYRVNCIPGEAVTITSGKYVRDVYYIGIPKKRFGGYFAYGQIAGGVWELMISREVLKEWFGDYRPDDPYSVLGLKFDTTLIQSDIKKAYVSMAKQWHPDVCHEPNAQQMFQEIQEAYGRIGTEDKRKNYNARRQMALQFTKHGLMKIDSEEVYVPRKRCGTIAFDGTMDGSRLRVDKILSWSDIVNQDGRTMVTYWDVSAKETKVRWI